MRKNILLSLVIIAILISAAAVSAEQNPCTVDSIGCWVSVDGGKQYIRFWSEESRPYLEKADFSKPDLVLLTAKDDNQVCQTLVIGGREIENCISQ